MPDLNDFHAFNSTNGGSSGSGGGGGCMGSGLSWILVVIGILWLIGKLCG